MPRPNKRTAHLKKARAIQADIHAAVALSSADTVKTHLNALNEEEPIYVETRAHCNYTFKGLEKTIPLALNSVAVKTIQHFARKSFRYMDAYRKGMDGALADIQVRKYKSHRRIPSNWSDI